MLSRSNACPFCGELATQVLDPLPGRGYQVECLNCGARGPAGGETEEAASRAWDHGDGFFTRPLVQTAPLPAEIQEPLIEEVAEWL